MKTTLIEEIMAFLFGRKYYANIIATKGLMKQEVSSYIFATKEAADAHKRNLLENKSYKYIDTVSFRSRKICLDATVKTYGVDSNAKFPHENN